MAAHGASLQLSVDVLPEESLAYTNKVFLSPDDAKLLMPPDGSFSTPVGNYVRIKDFIMTFEPHKKVKKGIIAVSREQRHCLELQRNETVLVSTYIATEDTIFLSSASFVVSILGAQKGPAVTIDGTKLKTQIRESFLYQFFTLNQTCIVNHDKVNVLLRLDDMELASKQSLIEGKFVGQRPPPGKARGILLEQTDIALKTQTSAVRIVDGGSEGSAMRAGSIIAPNFDFEKLGIGGLDKEFADIFRRAFASRLFSPKVVAKLGVKHVRGILLYGPPGTGKTLMARQIGKMLNAKEPKIVSGPEVLNKYVGQSEENIRNLFKDAEQEYKQRGDESDLHIIIFDEIDAICRTRGSRADGTGVGDSVVNQLLAKLDGVEQLNNILVIGMTNRKDMIDEALLRPGRLEVHMEINLPNEHGRLQILRIHTAKMAANKFLDDDVDLEELARLTKNFSGAEIEGLVKSAASFAFTRQVDVKNAAKAHTVDPEKLKVCRADFMRALAEVIPAFGAANNELDEVLRNGIIDYGPEFQEMLYQCKLFIKQVKFSDRTPLVSLLLQGAPGSGKTAIACTLAKSGDFPFIKLITPEKMVGDSEATKCWKISKVFDDAYKSPLSVVIVDDLERLIDYAPIGPRFSNTVLQALMVLAKKEPPVGRRLFIIGTTSQPHVLSTLGLIDCFSAVVQVPLISKRDQLRKILEALQLFTGQDLDAAVERFHEGMKVPIKRLITIAEMAKQGETGTLLGRFLKGLVEDGLGVTANVVDSGL